MSLIMGVPFYALNKPPELIGLETMRRAQSMIIVNKMQYCAGILRCKPNAVLERHDVILKSVSDFNIRCLWAI